MAISGEKRWPRMGRNRWPLTRLPLVDQSVTLGRRYPHCPFRGIPIVSANQVVPLVGRQCTRESEQGARTQSDCHEGGGRSGSVRRRASREESVLRREATPRRRPS